MGQSHKYILIFHSKIKMKKKIHSFALKKIKLQTNFSNVKLWTFYFCSTNNFSQWWLSLYFCYCNKIMYLVLLSHLDMNWDSIAYKKFPEIRMDPFSWFETGFLSLRKNWTTEIGKGGTHLSSDVKRSTLREIGDPSIRCYLASHHSPGLTRSLYNDLGSKNILTSAFHIQSS